MDKIKKCENCESSENDDGELFCHAFPPTVISIPVQHPISGQAGISMQAVFPHVASDWWCSYWREEPPKILDS